MMRSMTNVHQEYTRLSKMLQQRFVTLISNFPLTVYFVFYDESRKCLAHSYAVHDIAVAGIFAIILGFKPRQKPFQPRTLYMAFVALEKVSAFLNISSDTVSLPLTCKTVFIQSKGVVMAAHVAPLIPPHRQCINGL